MLLYIEPLTYHQHCSLCSYVGDVDIQATVKPPITAGIKELKVSTEFFCSVNYCMCLLLLLKKLF